jgi:quercetin dioxygenase-like cupin family protein
MRLCVQLAGLAAVLAVLGGSCAAAGDGAGGDAVPRVKVVRLEPGERSYLVLLNGPPETASMRSGLVTLAPGASIGKHNTEKNEEMLVPLEGEGELRVTGQPPVQVHPGVITYAPAHTEHDVTNTGTKPLRYIFIVAKAE